MSCSFLKDSKVFSPRFHGYLGCTKRFAFVLFFFFFFFSLSLSLRAIRQFTSFSLGFSAVICCLNVHPKKKRTRKKCVVFTQRRGGKRERQPLSNSTLILSVLDCALKRKKSVLFTSVHKVIINQAGNTRGTLPVPLRRD